ncbi:MAG: aminoacetone oxidase family FAD-binding enzyme, partial [Ruminiclostridium sp.]|nr:aminoacetone oxidase family FAD-binding enzyme [Ruminiclostridium sp.]
MNYDVIIIGGGAAGMLAAITAAENGCNTLILERNDILGKKLLITGKGRCNVTNNSDNDNIMKNIPSNSRFLYSALAGFSAYDVMSFFETLGVPLKTERGNRVFPVSDKAADIVNALKSRIKELDIKVINQRAEKIITDNSLEKPFVKGVKCGKSIYNTNNVILCTGGKSYPGTGSTGDGYKMAKELSHTITELKPSLVPINTVEDTKSIMGLSLKNVTLTLKNDKNKVLYSELGEMLFTHFGVSGPLV